MGLDPATIGYIIGEVGGKALGSALAPSPYQKRVSFSGTGADPVSWMTDLRNATSNVLNGAVSRANEPVDVGGNMPINPTPSFSGGGLPMTISSPNIAPPRVHLDGFGIQSQIFNQPGQTFPTHLTAGGTRQPDRTRPGDVPPSGHAVPRGTVGSGTPTGTAMPAPTTTAFNSTPGVNPQVQAAYSLLQHARLNPNGAQSA